MLCNLFSSYVIRLLGCFVRPPTDLAANTERQDPENVTASRRTLLSDRYVRALCDDDAAGHWQGGILVLHLIPREPTDDGSRGRYCRWMGPCEKSASSFSELLRARARVRVHTLALDFSCCTASKARTRTAYCIVSCRARVPFPFRDALERSRKSASGRLLRDRPCLGWAACQFVPFPGPGCLAAPRRGSL